MKKILCVLTALIMLAACAPIEEPATPAVSSSPIGARPEEVRLVDMAGSEITLAKAAQKVVSLAPSVTETVCALGFSDRLIGVDAYSTYPDTVSGLPVVGDYNGPDVEKIVALEPDAVLAGAGLQEDAINSLKKLGIPVVVAEPTTLEDVYAAVSLVGDVLGEKEAADSLSREIQAKLAGIKAMGEKLTHHPRVYYAMSYGEMGNWTCGPGSFINSLIELAGGTPAFTEGAEWMEVTLEAILTSDPQIIMVADDVGTADGLAAENGYKDTAAVKNGDVYAVDADVISRPGPRVAEAAEIIYNLVEKAE